MSSKKSGPVVFFPWDWDKDILEAVTHIQDCENNIERARERGDLVAMRRARNLRRDAQAQMATALGPDFSAIHLFKLCLDRIGCSAEATEDLALANQCAETRAATDALFALLGQRFGKG